MSRLTLVVPVKSMKKKI